MTATQSNPRQPISLYTGGALFGLPDASPFCIKAEVQLKMAGVPYVKAQGMPDQGPKGQIPYIEDEGRRLGDSTFIRAHIEKTYGVDLDAGLTPQQRALSWTIERLLENQLYWTVVYSRWLIPENFAKGPAQFFNRVPEAVRETLRQQVLERVTNNVRAAGPGRHSDAEIADLCDRSLSALSLLLGDQPYFMGERATAVDATALGVLASLLTPYFDTEVRRRVLKYPNLLAYTDRLMAEFYPDFAWEPAVAAAA
ncbi:glutathione S-transferase family protein [Nitrospirillum amazonense]|uniref:glutathione S-transferase family protein n=1 Tax=Nitrospirillum amazonense TaxID=28077 RepID=UPI002412440D|nr:glutathione S-transferase family protein [Nitrospirillum amazonense]MDG3440220.1 glutathione S-transferase family protein [Nitrospirillum amazonense]